MRCLQEMNLFRNEKNEWRFVIFTHIKTFMKYLLSALFTLFVFTLHAQHSLEKIWETDTVVKVPESVLPDFKKGILYVSLIDGAPFDVDGKGGVAILSIDGKNLNQSWITGLNSPKGLGRFGNTLYVADLTEVVVIDIAKGKIEKKIKVDSATGLNDITVTDKGVVYVSDSRTGKVHKIENGVATTYLNNMPGANGLKAIGNDLYILSGKSFIKADSKKNITKIADLEQAGDGLEPIGNGDFIATSWIGYVYYVHANGKVETLMDTHLQNKNTADIGYDPAKRIVYLPTFNGKQVVAYKLK
jgi:hypothetical protein